MPESVREQIKQNIMSAVGGITVANGYDIEVKTVDQDLKHWEEMPVTMMPYLCVVSGDEEYPYVTERTIRTKMFPVIWGEIRYTKDLDMYMNRLIHAVRKAILADKKRGGLATITYIRRILTDEGVFAPFCVLRFELEIEYHQPGVM